MIPESYHNQQDADFGICSELVVWFVSLLGTGLSVSLVAVIVCDCTHFFSLC